MGKKHKEPTTAAVRVLRAAGVAFEGHPYRWEEGGGTARFAAEAGVDEHLVVKTLIMEDEAGNPVIVLMHGDREVATGLLARAIGVKRMRPCDPKTAEHHSGCRVGGISPFGTRRPMPVYCEAGIAKLPLIYINGGKRGWLVALDTADALRLLRPTLVSICR
jgi:Cys-tRNA(Pro) deacylase